MRLQQSTQDNNTIHTRPTADSKNEKRKNSTRGRVYCSFWNCLSTVIVHQFLSDLPFSSLHYPYIPTTASLHLPPSLNYTSLHLILFEMQVNFNTIPFLSFHHIDHFSNTLSKNIRYPWKSPYTVCSKQFHCRPVLFIQNISRYPFLHRLFLIFRSWSTPLRQ